MYQLRISLEDLDSPLELAEFARVVVRLQTPPKELIRAIRKLRDEFGQLLRALERRVGEETPLAEKFEGSDVE